MEYQSPLIDRKFRSKFKNLKNEIEQFLINSNYILPEGLEVDNLIGWNNFYGFPLIYPDSDKCPSDIFDDIVILIQREFSPQQIEKT